LNEEKNLCKSAPHPRTRRIRISGFSMVELAVSMTVLLILTAIAIPTLMRSFRTYQLNDAAGRLSDLLKFTRFEAVRRNTPVTLRTKQTGNDWTVWTDSNNNGTADSTDKQILITGFVTLLPAGGSPGPPSSSSITAVLCQVASTCPATTLTTLSGANNFVSFDARGAVSPLAADVFYLGNATDPKFGYRAVILMPSGATQIWTGPAGGPWQRLS
jgi:type IV fimbrial biogenesis protein FimT